MSTHAHTGRTGPGKNEPIDLTKLNPEYFHAPPVPRLVKLPAARYLVIDGVGSPDGDAFQAAIKALFAVAYTIKMTHKHAGHGDYKVAPLEGRWFVRGQGGHGEKDLWKLPRETWEWQLAIMIPVEVTGVDLAHAQAAIAAKGGAAEAAHVRIEKTRAGQFVQALHVGPYATEPATIARMRARAADEGLAPKGHVEIYLGDPRRVAPTKLRTILLQPVAPA